MSEIVILSAARTPLGSFLGSLSSQSAPQLGAVAISAALERAGVAPDQVDDVLMGNVLTAGVGQAPARQAAIGAGIPVSAGALTVNKVCSSGLKAVMLGVNELKAGDARLVVAGGMENMSQAPHLLKGSRGGLRLGDAKLVDSMVADGLWDPYGDKHMGNCAETCAAEREISREDQDAYTLRSYQRAQESIAEGRFAAEIAAVTIKGRKGDTVVDTDEEPGRVKFDKIPQLRPVFDRAGSVTAANASSINDGAAALVVATAERAEELGLKPIARIVAHSTHSQEPEWFTTAPAGAVKSLLESAGLEVADIDLFEVNEAFAVVALAVSRELGLSDDKLNVNGGAVALGHPIGCSGARILTTLLHALEARGGRYGVVAICNGGGEATAMLVERIG